MEITEKRQRQGKDYYVTHLLLRNQVGIRLDKCHSKKHQRDSNPDKCQVQCHKGKNKRRKKIKLPQMYVTYAKPTHPTHFEPKLNNKISII